MTVAPPRETPASSPIEVLIPEARRRGRWHRLAWILAIAVAVVGVWLIVATAAGLPPLGPSSPAPVGSPQSHGGWVEWKHAWGAMSGATSTGNSVDCPSARFCAAVGASISTWNGATWHDEDLPPAPNRGENDQWGPVTCVSATFCVAGGTYNERVSSNDEAEVAVWDGRKWNDAELAATLNTDNADTDAVTCVSIRFCVAAGGYGTVSPRNDYYGLLWRSGTGEPGGTKR